MLPRRIKDASEPLAFAGPAEKQVKIEARRLHSYFG